MAEGTWAHLVGREVMTLTAEQFLVLGDVMPLGHPSDPYRLALAFDPTPYGALLTRLEFVQRPPIDPRWFVTERQAASGEWVTIQRYSTYDDAVMGHQHLVEAHNVQAHRGR